jgi:hypothetical protein
MTRQAPRKSDAQGRQSLGITSAHGQNGAAPGQILPEVPGQQEVPLTPGKRRACDLLAPIFRGEAPGARAVLTGDAGTGKTFLSARQIGLALATATRELGRGRPPFTSNRGDGSMVVAHPDLGSWRREAVRQVRIAAGNEAIDAVRVLSWTNAAAEKFNRLLHRAIYGPNAPPWVPGQLVVSSGVILGLDGAPLAGSTCEMELRAPMHAGVIKSSPPC